MNLFVDYVQPLTTWIQANPNWSLLATFLLALAESLAIIGSIVPGSVTMTAIGILAGSGVMRIDCTLIAAALGAIAGDSISYFLGYFYSDRLYEIWPFSKYPSLLIYGKDFFNKHGGKSVLIGRFVGPLRSIIPVIAGIMHMSQWRFLIPNIISGIGWALLYVLPGVAIGAASHELSAESATRLFLLILLILLGVWFFTKLINWLLFKLHLYLQTRLNDFWHYLKTHPVFYRIYDTVTPQNELNHYKTASLTMTALICAFLFILLIMLLTNTHFFHSINEHTHFFIQTFRTSLLVGFFIILDQLCSNLTLLSLYVVSSLWLITQKRYTMVFYLTSVMIISMTTGYLLTLYITNPRPDGLLMTMTGSSFPDTDLMNATAFYGFILFLFKNQYSERTKTLQSTLLVILTLNGIGALYLGDYWLSDVLGAYLGGAIICLVHCLIYRKNNKPSTTLSLPILLIGCFFLIMIATSLSKAYFTFDTLMHHHKPNNNQYLLSESDWWDQQEPILPLYRLNRLGNRISLNNIQYYGSLKTLKNSLLQQGWEVHTGSFLKNLLIKMDKKSNKIKLPLFSQLYQNSPPQLVMTYQDKKTKTILVIRVWESNYNLNKTNNPLWIGSIELFNPHKPSAEIDVTSVHLSSWLLPSLTQYTVRRVFIPKKLLTQMTRNTEPYIVLIKER
jgi:membrane protein DedA with SNARE-associated domain/membrane-associated phospholipid phosphatase